MDINYELLGKNIRKLRTSADMTQRQLAELVGVTDRHIGQVEAGKNVPSLSVTVAIANALNVGVDQLLYGDLENREDYFIKELNSLTEGFNKNHKAMIMELVNAIVTVLKSYKK